MKIRFDHESFYFQIHNLPLAWMTRDYGKQIGSTIGRVEEMDIQDDGVGWINCLHVKINMALHKVLVRGRSTNVNECTAWLPL